VVVEWWSVVHGVVVEWWSVVHGVVVEWWSVVEGCLVEVQLAAGDVVSRPLYDDHVAAAAVIFTARTQHFHRRDAIAVALCLSVLLVDLEHFATAYGSLLMP